MFQQIVSFGREKMQSVMNGSYFVPAGTRTRRQLMQALINICCQHRFLLVDKPVTSILILSRQHMHLIIDYLYADLTNLALRINLLNVMDQCSMLDLEIVKNSKRLAIFRRNATHCISPYAIVVCVGVWMWVYAAFVDLRLTVWDRDFVIFFKLCRITPDIICKSLTQIWLQIPRWRTKWRPWNTIIDCNSAIY